MQSATYIARRRELQTYFDRTAAEAWSRLTSDAPVSRIRATVRAGRDEMRAAILGYLPRDLAGRRVLDAGCGTGALAVEAARRGAEVVAVDVAETLVRLAEERCPPDVPRDRIRFVVGDMLDPGLGRFDHVVAMDSLIHYRGPDMVAAIAGLARRADASLVTTFAPRTPLLGAMHAVGQLFPRGNRSPAIEPIRAARLEADLVRALAEEGLLPGRTRRVARGFYISQALEVVRS